MVIVLILVNNIKPVWHQEQQVVGGGGDVMFKCIITNTENSLCCLIFLWN